MKEKGARVKGGEGGGEKQAQTIKIQDRRGGQSKEEEEEAGNVGRH